MQTDRLTIHGMHCPSCEKLIMMELDDLAGIESFLLDPETGELEVTYDPSQVSLDEIEQAITEAGTYTVTR